LSLTPGGHVVGEDSLGLGLNSGIRGMAPRRTSLPRVLPPVDAQLFADVRFAF